MFLVVLLIFSCNIKQYSCVYIAGNDPNCQSPRAYYRPSILSDDQACCPIGHYCHYLYNVKYVCSAGTYQNMNGQTTCITCFGGPCAAGQYVPPCPTTSNTACTPCSTSPCPAGQYQTPCTTTSDRVCTPCSPGSFSTTSGVTVCTPCLLGSNFSNTTGATSCTPCSGPCPAGTYQTQPCTTSSDRVCTPCVLGSSFSLTSGTTQCLPCTQTPCPSRTIKTQNCTLTSDVVCSQCDDVFVCPQDHYCDD